MFTSARHAKLLTCALLLRMPLLLGCQESGGSLGGDDAYDAAGDAGLDEKGKKPKPPKGGGNTGGAGSTTGAGTGGGATTGGGTAGNTGSTTGGATGGTTGATTGATTGGTSGPKPAWCVGEDTDVRPAPNPAEPCNLCGRRELNVQNWQNNGPCLQAWSKVASMRTDSPQCVAASAQMQASCCLGFYEPPARTQCKQKGPYASVDLCQDGCFPSNPATAGTYSIQAGGPLAPWIAAMGNRSGTCYQDDATSPGALTWTCRRAYYLLKNGYLPPAQASEVISWWRGSHSLSANCGCDAKNTNNPNH